jgi:hypothetical protein
MKSSSTSYWRAFWLTAAVIGTLNSALFLHFLSLPIEQPGKGGGPPGRVSPRWAKGAMWINLPGLAVLYAVRGTSDPESESVRIAGMVFCQITSTLIWAVAAIGVIWLEKRVRPPAPNSEGGPESNDPPAP